MRAESITSVPFPFATTLFQQENSEGYFKRAVLNNSRLPVGRNAKTSYSIWDLAEWDEEYGALQLDWREAKTGKYDIMLMGGDVRGDWVIDFFQIMTCYFFKMNNCGKLW